MCGTLHDIIRSLTQDGMAASLLYLHSCDSIIDGQGTIGVLNASALHISSLLYLPSLTNNSSHYLPVNCVPYGANNTTETQHYSCDSGHHTLNIAYLLFVKEFSQLLPKLDILSHT